MYLHIGQGYVVKTRDIIGIFDIDNTSVSKKTREYLNKKEKQGSIINTAADIPKSFIVTENKNKIKVYLSQPTPTTLIKRVNFIEKE